jgi:hypothetical protein
VNTRIAIIGGGLAGCLTALQLAHKGIPSEIFERNDSELMEASFYNEGKVHLGFLYALDSTRETSQLMIEGAAYFRRIILEMTGFDVAKALSTPFFYGVHRDSLVSPTEFEAHLRHCSEGFSSFIGRTPSSAGYVNAGRSVGFGRLAESDWSEDLNPELFSAVFQTDEYGVDPRRLSQEVSRAVRENPFIELHTGVKVDTVHSPIADRWSLTDQFGDAVGSGLFDVVLNSTWSDLLRIDSQVGIPFPEEWSYRFKLGNRVQRAVMPEELRSVTVVLGAFGDIVNYGEEGGVFLSWYPSGRLLMTDEVDLPDWNGPGFELQRKHAFEESRVVWESMSQKLRALDVDEYDVDTRGGMILATGRLDVDDASSPLHSRVKIGVSQKGSFFSLNTGKYTLAPIMAVHCAERIRRYLMDN